MSLKTSRYCLERRQDSTETVLHQQSCFAYAHASLLADGKVVDVGIHDAPARALENLCLEESSVSFCQECCSPSGY